MTDVQVFETEKKTNLKVWLSGLVVILVITNVVTYATFQNYVTSHSYSNSEYWDYVSDHSHTNSEYWNYVDDHSYTNDEYDEAKFDFYYVMGDEQKFGVYELEDELAGLYWIEPYQEGVFDCSEMTAYLEWFLENEDWNAIMVLGDAPFGGGRHAWLLVETNEGGYMPVESTNIEIVWWSDPHFDNYFVYDYSLDDIYEAVSYDESEFDWWA